MSTTSLAPFTMNVPTIVTILDKEKKETCEGLAKVQKRNLHLEAQLTHDKTN
jgi:hypothetical protein